MTSSIARLVILLKLSEFGICVVKGLSLHVSPSSPQVKEIYSSVVFTCSIDDCTNDCSHLKDLFWRTTTGEKILSSDNNRVTAERINRTAVRLYVKNIQEDDEGLYTCVAVTSDDITVTQNAELLIYEDIVFQEGPTNVSKEIGRDAFLECAATGIPQPTISWRFDKEAIPSDTAKYKYEKGGLRIFKVIPTDGGQYECCAEVTSQGNFKVKTITLNVLYPPVITATPNSTVALRGSDVTLTCRAHGNPSVQFSWHREQKASEHIKVKVKLSEGSDTHHIKNINDDDIGKYYCRVSNSQGMREVSADVTLMVPPRIVELPHKTTMEFGTVIILCESTGIPPPVIKWKRLGEDEPYVDGFQLNDRRVSVESNVQQGRSKLVLHNITRSYAGFYTCTATNDAGSDSKNATLTVEFRPSVVITVNEMFGWKGQVRNITCRGQGMPPPSINWLRGGHYILDNHIYSIKNTKLGDTVTSVLKITIDEDFFESYIYDTYQCIAKNHFGSDVKPMHFRQAMEPEMPKNVTVVRQWPFGVLIQAEAARRRPNLPITSWMIKYSQSVNDREAEEKVATFPSGDHMEILDLLPETAYILQVSAGNEVGYGSASKIKIVTPSEIIDKPQEQEESEEEKFADISVRTFVKKEDIEQKKTLTTPSLFIEIVTRDPGTNGGGVVEVRQQQSISSAEGGFQMIGISLFTVISLVSGTALLIGCILGILCMRRSHKSKGNKYPSLLNGYAADNTQQSALRTAALAKDFEHIPMMAVQQENDALDHHSYGGTNGINGLTPKVSSTENRVKVKPQMTLFTNPLSGYETAAMDMQLYPITDVTSGGGQKYARNKLTTLPLMNKECAELGSPVYLYGELPPPPPFLLQPEGREMSSVHSILDSYHSAETVDDLDEFDSSDVTYFEKYPYFANV